MPASILSALPLPQHPPPCPRCPVQYAGVLCSVFLPLSQPRRTNRPGIVRIPPHFQCVCTDTHIPDALEPRTHSDACMGAHPTMTPRTPTIPCMLCQYRPHMLIRVIRTCLSASHACPRRMCQVRGVLYRPSPAGPSLAAAHFPQLPRPGHAAPADACLPGQRDRVLGCSAGGRQGTVCRWRPGRWRGGRYVVGGGG